MATLIKYADSNTTKDHGSDDDKSNKSKKSCNGKGQQQNVAGGNGNNQGNGGKRRHPKGGSDLVANTNTGYKNQRRSGNAKPSLQGLFGRPAYAKFMSRPCYVYLQLKMPGQKGTITAHGDRKVALECEEGDPTYAESAYATEELKFYKDNVDPADMTPPKKPTTDQDPLLKFKADDTKQVDFVPGDSSQQFTIGANMDPK
nr:uncharacterized protein LOC109769160 [Aegilops tauschii subsp. strangulata]